MLPARQIVTLATFFARVVRVPTTFQTYRSSVRYTSKLVCFGSIVYELNQAREVRRRFILALDSPSFQRDLCLSFSRLPLCRGDTNKSERFFAFFLRASSSWYRLALIANSSETLDHEGAAVLRKRRDFALRKDQRLERVSDASERRKGAIKSSEGIEPDVVPMRCFKGFISTWLLSLQASSHIFSSFYMLILFLATFCQMESVDLFWPGEPPSATSPSTRSEAEGI